jgi:hypothetical protein
MLPMMVVEDVMIGVPKGGNESSREPKHDVLERYPSLIAHDLARAASRVSEIYRGIDDPAQSWSFCFDLFTAQLAEGIIAQRLYI